MRNPLKIIKNGIDWRITKYSPEEDKEVGVANQKQAQEVQAEAKITAEKPTFSMNGAKSFKNSILLLYFLERKKGQTSSFKININHHNSCSNCFSNDLCIDFYSERFNAQIFA